MIASSPRRAPSPDSLAVARRAALSQLSYTTSRDTNLRDRAGRNWLLDSLGTVAPGEEETIRRSGQPMAMNNTGDTIDLLDADGQVVDSVTYGVVAEGEFVISN